MGDVIIAVIPAPGHEGLVAEGPSVAGCTPERPMLVWQCGCGRWGHFGCAELIQHAMSRPRALVLHAPGGPRLGMVRAMEAAGIEELGEVDVEYVDEFDVAEGEPWGLMARIGNTVDVPWTLMPMPQWANEWADADDRLRAYALAHLLRQRGLASEVLVLPVPA